MDEDTRLPALLDGRIVEQVGDNKVVYEVLAAESFEQAERWAKDNRPSYHCTHDYDCCGRFYPSDAEVWIIGDASLHAEVARRYVVMQYWSLNV